MCRNSGSQPGPSRVYIVHEMARKEFRVNLIIGQGPGSFHHTGGSLAHVVITLPATGRVSATGRPLTLFTANEYPSNMPDAPSQATDGQVTEAVVAWDFHAREPDELSLRRGERDRMDR